MEYAVDSTILRPVVKLLPSPAMAEFVVAANNASHAGMEHNDCMKAAWSAVNEGWQRGKNSRYVRKDNPTSSSTHVDAPLGAAGSGKKPKRPAPAIDDEAGDDVEGESVDQVRVTYRANKVLKVDDSLGLVFGWAIVCSENNEPYFDLQGDNIPEDTMLKSAADFMQNSRVAAEMHGRDEFDQPIEDGSVVFAFPMTSDIAKAMGIETQTTGLMIAIKPSEGVLQKFKNGDFTGFSVGGYRGTDEIVEP